MKTLIENWHVIVAAIPAVIAIASMIVRLTPTHGDDQWFQVIVDTLGRLGIYRDNGDGSYSLKTPVIGSAKPKDESLPPRPPIAPAIALLLAASVCASSCARPIATAKQAYAQSRETYRTTVLEVAVDLRAAGFVSDADWAVFLALHEKVRRADAMLKATLVAAERVESDAERGRLLADAGAIMADMVRLIAEVSDFVDSLKCNQYMKGADTCYPLSKPSLPSGTGSARRPERQLSKLYQAPLKHWQQY